MFALAALSDLWPLCGFVCCRWPPFCCSMCVPSPLAPFPIVASSKRVATPSMLKCVHHNRCNAELLGPACLLCYALLLAVDGCGNVYYTCLPPRRCSPCVAPLPSICSRSAPTPTHLPTNPAPCGPKSTLARLNSWLASACVCVITHRHHIPLSAHDGYGNSCTCSPACRCRTCVSPSPSPSNPAPPKR